MSLYTSLIKPTTNTENINFECNWVYFTNPVDNRGQCQIHGTNGRFKTETAADSLGGFYARNTGRNTYARLTPEFISFGTGSPDQGGDVFRISNATATPTIAIGTQDLEVEGNWVNFTNPADNRGRCRIHGTNGRFKTETTAGSVGGFFAQDINPVTPYYSRSSPNFIVLGLSEDAEGGARVLIDNRDISIKLFNGNDQTELLNGGGASIIRTNGNKSFSFDKNGNASAPGSFIDGSDRNTKTNIQTLGSANATYFIDKVKALRPVTFQRLGTNLNETETGLIAQEVGEILPSAMVTTYAAVTNPADPEGLSIPEARYGLRYSVVTANMLAAMKQLITKVETLEAQVAALS